MKKLIFPMILAALVAVPALSSAAELKVAVVDMEAVFKEFKKSKLVNKDLNERAASIKAEIDEAREKYTEKMEKLEEARQKAKDIDQPKDQLKERQEKFIKLMGEARQMELENKQLQETRLKDLSDQRQRKYKLLILDIKEELNKIGDEKKVNLILNRTQLSTATLLYHNGVEDVTKELIKRLNSK